MKETFRCEYVRCGKARCTGCPHGPYWYAYHKEAGKTRKRYVGKDRPEPPAAGDPDDAIFNRSTATAALARSILGLTGGEGEAEARRAFLKLVKVHHPDCGGDDHAFAKVSAAWSWLRGVMGWR